VAAVAQVKPNPPYVSKVWVSDQGNGTYKNPVLHSDYSDPDVVRVGNNYYLTSSSFEAIPGLPILHSKDLVNWTLIGHALKRQEPLQYFSMPRHGQGVWAPSIRFHKGEFYIYYPDPDFGIYLTRAKNAAGPWSDPVLVEGGKGLIDPCPLWDEDGKVYLVHAYAGSRAGIGSIIVMKRLNAEGTKTVDDGMIVYDGRNTDPTIEGPKIYKANGYYYIFAPAGGVTRGWQLVLRSKTIYGPYERRVVMRQGNTPINGPHQGAWVNTLTGEDWFLHFQDKGPYGRVVHLNPMTWKDGWPVIGLDKDGDGTGEPVLTFKKPNTGPSQPLSSPVESDEFNTGKLGLQWQWMANSKAGWGFINATNGSLRLYTEKIPDSARNLWEAPSVLLQKFPAEEFSATTKFNFVSGMRSANEKMGLAVMGFSYANLSVKIKADGTYLVYTVCKKANTGQPEQEKLITKLSGTETVYMRVIVKSKAKCTFSYSIDGNNFIEIGEEFQAEMGRWIGAKVGLFASRETVSSSSGYADFDWFRIEK
jgi:beta-xylosidase